MDELPALDHRFPPDLAELAPARRLVREVLAEASVDDVTAEDLVVAVSELLTDAVQRASDDPCRLTVGFEPACDVARRVVVEVAATENPDGVAPMLRHAGAGTLDEGSPGLAIVRAVCGGVEQVVEGRRRLLRCRKTLSAA